MVMLFKEILEQPTKGPSNHRTNKCKAVPKKVFRKHSDKQKSTLKAKHQVGVKKGMNSHFPASKPSRSLQEIRQNAVTHRTTKFDSNIPSSTPVFTPIKKDKLPPPSITSSQYSLIELLQQYNVSTSSMALNCDGEIRNQSSVNEQQNPVTPEEITVDPQFFTFKEVVHKLFKIVNSNKNGDEAVRQAYNDVHAAFKSLPVNERNCAKVDHSTLDIDKTVFPKSVSLEELQIENLSLQRKLRLAEKDLNLQKNKSQSTDINLELMTLQCQNKALEQKVTELTKSLEQAMHLHQSTITTNNKLSFDNDKLKLELSQKRDELAKSGDLFSSETKEIKKDVGEALLKVESLRLSVEETNNINEELKTKIEEKDQEIERLSELNKGLQCSVSRLLEDLKKTSLPSENLEDVQSTVLKKLDRFLSSPTKKPFAKTQALSKPAYEPSKFSVTNVTTSNNFSQKNTFPVICRPPTPDSDKISYDMENTAPASIKSVVGSLVTPSLPTTNSVSSSMWSITSHDEREFTAGLASLDADIRRLQQSLQGFNIK